MSATRRMPPPFSHPSPHPSSSRAARRRQWQRPCHSDQPCAAWALLALVAAASYLAGCAAYPSGAPEQACKELRPGHGVDAQQGAPPFELVQDRAEAGPGDQIKVTLSSPSKATFKGLMVQALDESGAPSGRFLAGTGLKLIDSCSAVTHSDKEPKKTATLVWEPAADLKSKHAFTFRATVVQKFDQYYLNIKSTVQSASRRR